MKSFYILLIAKITKYLGGEKAAMCSARDNNPHQYGLYSMLCDHHDGNGRR